MRPGDDASCLNLNRAQQPTLLGVDPAELARREAFTFQALGKDVDAAAPWKALEQELPDGAIPGVADYNSMMWAMRKKIGDTVDYVDQNGKPVAIRLVGAVANSILQGHVIIAKQAFTRIYPYEDGHRVFLVDAPQKGRAKAADALTRALSDSGLELIPTDVRLNRFNAVQNTYL